MLATWNYHNLEKAISTKPLWESAQKQSMPRALSGPWQCCLMLLFQNYDKFKISSQHAGHLEIIIIWKKQFQQNLMMLPWPWWLHMLCHLQDFSVPKNAQDLLPGLNLLFHNYDKSETSSQHAGRLAIFIIGKKQLHPSHCPGSDNACHWICFFKIMIHSKSAASMLATCRSSY